MVSPVVARVLLALGMTGITLTGSTLAYDALLAQVQNNVGSLPAVALQLGGLLGVWQSLGIMLGAASFVLTWNAATGFWKLAKS